MPSIVLGRFGEIFLKSGNRKRFEAVLRRNMQAAVADLPGARVEAPHGRVTVSFSPGKTAAAEAASGAAAEDAGAAEEAAARLERVFGLVSLSVAAVVPADLGAIGDAAVAAAERALATRPAVSFKVDARRTDKAFPHPSMEIARRVGERVLVATGVPVDVHRPALRIGVEVAPGRAYVYGGVRPAPGGLPVGSSGSALLLLSGGIDSPVAGWLAAKRGLAVDAVYFHSPPFVGEKSRDKVLALGRVLHRWQACQSVTVVPFTETQKRLRDAGAAELAVVLYRRMMMRIADAIADARGADALVTGENLGQVASQTVQNLSAIDDAAHRLVLRPLLTNDKVETTALAKRIGTYETSILPFDDCCSLFVPRHPATAARRSDVERAEANLDVAAEVAAAVAGAELVRMP
jgi:tRNA uracil 4-sulfurtransferase